jgi:hypothetical protein
VFLKPTAGRYAAFAQGLLDDQLERATDSNGAGFAGKRKGLVHEDGLTATTVRDARGHNAFADLLLRNVDRRSSAAVARNPSPIRVLEPTDFSVV